MAAAVTASVSLAWAVSSNSAVRLPSPASPSTSCSSSSSFSSSDPAVLACSAGRRPALAALRATSIRRRQRRAAAAAAAAGRVVVALTEVEEEVELVKEDAKGTLRDIERALLESDLGLTPSNDGNVIRLIIPPLTQERRKELTKLVAKLAEEGKVSLRNVRRDALKSLTALEKHACDVHHANPYLKQQQQQDGNLSKDNLRDLSDEIQKLTDDFVAKVDELQKVKDKDIMSV
eukprot:jgi/Chlat1/7024/Chrsp56S09117